MTENILNLSPWEDILLCRNTHCQDKKHTEDIDKYGLEILEAISDSVKNNIPTTGARDNKMVAGWNEEVKGWQNEARFYYALWVSAGRPNNTELHWSMKHSRNQYHYAIRRAKRNETAIRNNKFIL